MGVGYEHAEKVDKAVDKGAVLVTVEAEDGERARKVEDLLEAYHPAGSVDVLKVAA